MFAFGNLDPAMREKLYRLEPVAMLSKSYVSGAVKVLQGRGLCGKGGSCIFLSAPGIGMRSRRVARRIGVCSRSF